MNIWISMLNGGAVSIFGSVLSASFCNALSEKRQRRIFWCSVILMLLIQGTLYAWWEGDILRRVYPLVMHLPLMIILYLLTRKLLWPFISILAAYSCCQMRRWLALLVVEIFSGSMLMQETVELVITLPLLMFLLFFVSPLVRKLSNSPVKMQCQFGVIPALYYGFDYMTLVYTNVLYSGSPVAVEFMPFVCCVLYLIFWVYNAGEEQKRNELQQQQKCLDIQLAQAVQEIDSLRESQVLMRQYRHDLRHHLQYVSVCMENGQIVQAQTYITGIFKEIEAQAVKHYCENEAVNLILSAFAGRIEKKGIYMHVKGGLPAMVMVSDSDLCVLLSNALENALHACEPMAVEGKECAINVQFYERRGKIFLQITNPCREGVRFEKGLPVTEKPGHGIGVQSICAIVEKYKGVYSFHVQEGQFILRISL